MRRVLGLATWLIFVSAVPARADLINLRNGMIYDTVQDLTWLQDTRFARTSGYDADGLLSKSEAISWAENLAFGGYSDWRLPVYLSTPPQSPDDVPGSSELAGLFHQLGWRAEDRWGYDYSTLSTRNIGEFLNFESSRPVEIFWFGNGTAQGWHSWYIWDTIDGGDRSARGAWAVREGLARVPEPSSLLALGLGGLAFLRMRRRQAAAAKA